MFTYLSIRGTIVWIRLAAIVADQFVFPYFPVPALVTAGEPSHEAGINVAPMSRTSTN